jgi:catechol 2,3-dioxygenase-like lactoylglutathione lyase family enzyme
MIATAVHHVSFRVEELEPALHFYRDILGLLPIERPDFGFPGAWLQAGTGTQIHIIVSPKEDASAPRKLTPIDNHTAFAIDDYEATRDYLRAQGLEVLETNPKQGQMWVADPSGNVIEFTTGATIGDD